MWVSKCVKPFSLGLKSDESRARGPGRFGHLHGIEPAPFTDSCAALPIGEHVDATVFDPETKLIFNANGEGTMTVIKEDSANQYQVVENVPTQRGARTIALDEATHRLFLPDAQLGPTPTPTPAAAASPSCHPAGDFYDPGSFSRKLIRFCKGEAKGALTRFATCDNLNLSCRRRTLAFMWCWRSLFLTI